jgi:hypothetical protein
VKVCISDAAAKTVIVPVEDELVVLDVLELLEQPAAATATSASTAIARRRMYQLPD